MTMIESPTNPLIKETAALHRKAERDATGLILVETRHPVEEALLAGLRLTRFFHLAETPLPAALPVDIEPIVVTEKAMARLSSTDSPSPCAAVFEKPSAVLIPANGAVMPLVLILDAIQDPGNAGTLIRAAAAFGITHVILSPGSVDVYSPKVIRSSAGLVFRVPLLRPEEASPEAVSGFFQECRHPWKIYLTAAHGENPLSYRDADYRNACAIVLGNEGRGISDELVSLLNGLGHPQAITIPMAEGVESLNVSISGSIILAEAAARRTESVVG